ncbi:AAA family ATPase [Cyclobacterium sp. 1_MG-2023]|uniref:AAA family ATPase n=1 Tax=Cyclobacterium sp. 1_MG-2023 TaxID=3062681 RepID=UPI0026E278E6|nr:AAA family ATPase [Cyclobacterium sp. 1_MG-2023]MDO6440499.1 AAA family ATPase [Cyclobacterium sp. 1_MG-2023]
MIKNIEHIEKISCFDSFQWNDTPEFQKYNFIFGFNGSGKTSLSNIFNLVTSKSNYSEDKKKELFQDLKNHDSSKIKIATGNNQKLTYPPTESQNNRNIFVFNSNFISDHVYDGTKGNLKKFNVSSTELNDPEIKKITDNIETKEEIIKGINKKIKKAEEDFSQIKKDYNSDFRKHFANKQLSIDKKLPDASSVPTDSVEQLQEKLNLKIKEHKLSKNQKSLEEDIQSFSQLTFPQIKILKSDINKVFQDSVSKIATDSLTKKISDYQEIVEEDDVRKVEPWYKFGNELFKKISSIQNKKCPLCDSNINDSYIDLVNSFSAYFDKEYEVFITKIDEQISLIEQQIKTIKETNTNYEKLLKLYIKYSDFINHSPSEFSTIELERSLSEIKDGLNKKKNNSNKNITFDFSDIRTRLMNHNQVMEELSSYVESLKENLLSKIKSPSEIESTIRGIYKSLVYKSLNSKLNGVEKYHSNCELRIKTEKEIEVLQEEKVQRLKDLKLEAKKVGEFLIRLGINHFTIDLNEESEGNNILVKYKSQSQIKSRLRNTLSEGEKTALAFSYFLSKVTIETKNPSQTIIVIDDPISSLDDNRIYNTASLIYDTFHDYKQLFILSHNFFFLKYIYPSFRKGKSCYLISNGNIDILPKSLQNFQTPYYYMIESISSFIEENDKNYDEARKYLPNYIRRVLETFFSFKYAKLTRAKNVNQSPGLDDFIKDYIDFSSLPLMTVDSITNENIKDKLQMINNVCDNFSHGNMQQLENTNFIANQTLDSISKDCLSIIDFFDGIHFQMINELNTAE